jgi:hypothetical protein
MRARFRSGFVRLAALPTRGTSLLRVGVLLGLVALVLWLAPAAQAQQTRPDSTQADTVQADTVQADTVQADTVQADTVQADTVQADTLSSDSLRSDSERAGPARRDSLASRSSDAAGRGDPPDADGAVKFSARDSLVVVFGEEGEGDVGTLYGEARVEQKDATLTAYEVQILFNRNELRAAGPPEGVRVDTLALPRFQRGESEAFTGRRLSFNLDSRRGRVIEARTGYEEGFVQGQAVRVEEDSTVFVRGGRYTTCNCPRGETPSYSLRSGKMKVQGDWVYTGPIQLFIYNIPMPLILPFAFLPAVAGRHGGIIFPKYGHDNRLGLYLQNFGYYWPISDYMGLRVKGSLWSRGSWNASSFFEYKRRYYYDGDLRLEYRRNLFGDVVDNTHLNKTNVRLGWNHQQWFIPRGAPNSLSLRADVDLESQTNREIISDDRIDDITRETTSNVNFNKEWNDGNQQLSLKLRQNQNFTTENARLTLPSLSFDQRNIKPFERERIAAGDDERWYERITTSYSGDLDNGFRFNPLSDEELIERGDSSATDIAWYDALFSQEKYRRATGDAGQRFDFSATHRIPVRATFRLPRYQLNVTPNFRYNETWLPSTTRKEQVIEGTGAEADTTVVERDESEFFAAREFRLGVSSSTTFYGQFPLRLGSLRGLRHEVQPSLSFSYAPDYSTDLFGRTRSYRDEDDELTRYDIVTGRDLRNPSGRRSISFSVRNEFETKQVRVDSTGAEQEETLRLMTIDASSDYNFAADEFRLNDLTVRTDFPVLDTKYNIDAGARLRFSPYVFDEEGQPLNRLVLTETNVFPVRLTDFDLTVRTDFQGGDAEDRRDPFERRSGADRSTGGISRDPLSGDRPGSPSGRPRNGGYANFDIPWSLDLRLTYGFSNRETFEQSDFLVNADFDFNLTPRWKVSGSSGYDFDRGEVVRTQFDITRDFQCWQMSFNWVPFGRSQRYGFNLHVKSGVLRDLLNLRIPREDVKDRFRGVLSRARR